MLSKCSFLISIIWCINLKLILMCTSSRLWVQFRYGEDILVSINNHDTFSSQNRLPNNKLQSIQEWCRNLPLNFQKKSHYKCRNLNQNGWISLTFQYTFRYANFNRNKNWKTELFGTFLPNCCPFWGLEKVLKSEEGWSRCSI